MKRFMLWFLLLLPLTLAACGSASTDTVEEEAPPAIVEEAPAEEAAAVEEEPADASAVEQPEEPAVESETGVTFVSEDGRTYPPSEPAPLDEFRSDPAEAVGATGNIQLVEFFAFW